MLTDAPYESAELLDKIAFIDKFSGNYLRLSVFICFTSAVYVLIKDLRNYVSGKVRQSEAVGLLNK